MADSALERVASLLRLAGSDNENEARSAALAVCRLILKERLIVVRTLDVVAPAPAPAVRAPGPVARHAPMGWTNGPEELARKAREILDGGKKKPMTPRPVVMASTLSTPLQITAKFQGTCEDCRKPYAQGTTIWYRRGVGAVHVACSPEALV